MRDPEDTNGSPYAVIGRRELLRIWGPPALASAALAAAGLAFAGRRGRHHAPEQGAAPVPKDWRKDPGAAGRLAEAGGQGAAANLRRALGPLGGIGAFVARGETVAIKPNCAWDRRPEQAANTDPELIGELVRLCRAAGAARVTVVDNTCHDPERAFTRSGIEQAAVENGGVVAHQRSARTVTLGLGGSVLGPWEVLRPIADADRLINVPVVKHHSLSQATLGMKNWFGAVVGRRPNLHQRIHQVCAELGAAFRPTLTIVDGTRVLTGGGPTGGSLSLVNTVDRIAAASDPVAADAWGAGLLGLAADELPYLAIAARMGLGTTDWQSIAVGSS